jgi:hypothetical protein
LGGARAGDAAAPTINDKKHRQWPPLAGADGDLRVSIINVKTSTADPLGGARAGDMGMPTINAKKRRRRPPWEAVLEIRERPPSMLENIDGGPPERC